MAEIVWLEERLKWERWVRRQRQTLEQLRTPLPVGLPLKTPRCPPPATSASSSTSPTKSPFCFGPPRRGGLLRCSLGRSHRAANAGPHSATQALKRQPWRHPLNGRRRSQSMLLLSFGCWERGGRFLFTAEAETQIT